MTSRREFLLITAGIPLLVTAGACDFAVLGVPTILANGEHDDTAGLQAAMNGDPFVCPSALVVYDASTRLVEMRGGRFRLSRTVFVPGGARMCWIDAGEFLYSERPCFSCPLDVAAIFRAPVFTYLGEGPGLAVSFG